MKSGLLIASVLLLSAPAWAAPFTRVHHYIGSDRSQWKMEAASNYATASTSSLIYAGGNYPISIAKIAEDTAGNTYVIGNWLVTDRIYPAYAPLPPAQSAVIVSKIDPAGAIVYVTHVGGKGNDTAKGIVVDSSGNVYGVGYTTSPDFPLEHAVQTIPGGSTTGFIFKLDSSGDLVWSTYFGGSGLDYAGSSVNAVATDSAGNVYVTGSSDQANLTTSTGAFQTSASVGPSQPPGTYSSAFVAKFGSSGALVYSTWLGGTEANCYSGSSCLTYSRSDVGSSIAVDNAGNAYVAGGTNSLDFPTTPGSFQTSCNCPYGTFDGFLTKINPTGTGLVYSTYISGFGTSAMAIDGSGKVYFAGTTIPTTESPTMFQILVAVLNSAGSALTSSTSVGGNTGSSAPTGIALDTGGDIFLCGTTTSPTFPSSLPGFPAGTNFLIELSPDLTKVLGSVRLPGETADADVAIDPASGDVLVASSSGDLMRLTSLSSALPPVLGVGNAASLTLDGALAPQEVVAIYGIGIGPQQPVTAQPVSGVFPTSLGGIQVSFNGNPAPLLYVSANQINTVVSDSPSVDFGPETVRVVLNGAEVGELALPLTENMPGIFHNTDGSAAAVNQDGTINSATNPAKSGSTISIWGTGASYSTLVGMQAAVEVLMQGALLKPLPISYAGPAPGLVAGVFQINVQLPEVTSNSFPLQVLAGGILSPVVFVYVTL